MDSIGIESKNIHEKRKKKQFQLQSGYSYAPRDISFCEKVLVCALVVVILRTLCFHTCLKTCLIISGSTQWALRIARTLVSWKTNLKFINLKAECRNKKPALNITTSWLKDIYPVCNSFDCDISMRFRSTTKWFGTWNSRNRFVFKHPRHWLEKGKTHHSV